MYSIVYEIYVSCEALAEHANKKIKKKIFKINFMQITSTICYEKENILNSKN